MLETSRSWVESDLQSLVDNKITESLSLEYKSSEALSFSEEKHKKEFIKDVSAFANSEGGALVYGIVEEDHFPKQLDDGVDPKVITKERIEQIIHSGIRPKIAQLHINQIKLNNSENVWYVITVPQSDTAHQVTDHRYYKRYNFLSTPMEDYEIRDVMNRVKYPKIEPVFNCIRSKDSTSEEHQYSLAVTLRNEGSIRAHQIKFEVLFPAKLMMQNTMIFTVHDLERSREIPFDMKVLTLFRDQAPIFPKDEVKYTVLSFRVDEKLHNFITTSSPLLYWRLYADDAPPISGESFIEGLISF